MSAARTPIVQIWRDDDGGFSIAGDVDGLVTEIVIALVPYEDRWYDHRLQVWHLRTPQLMATVRWACGTRVWFNRLDDVRAG